jgi:predicted ArsR family transcriptional regulator
MSGMLDDTSAQIVRCLMQVGGSTIPELSRAIERSTVTVRRRLLELESQGAVEVVARHHVRGPGRPEKVYSLTLRGHVLLPDNYQELACRLVEHLFTALPDSEARVLLAGSAVQLAESLSRGWPEDPALRRRRALQALDARGYFPAWREAAPGQGIVFGHCPYLLATTRVRDVCIFDSSLVMGLLHSEVALGASIAVGEPACVFLTVDIPRSYRIK